LNQYGFENSSIVNSISFIESVSVDMNMVVHFGRNTTFHYTSDLNPTDQPTEFSIPSFFRLIKAHRSRNGTRINAHMSEEFPDELTN
jgi:hypothetical protein